MSRIRGEGGSSRVTRASQPEQAKQTVTKVQSDSEVVVSKQVKRHGLNKPKPPKPDPNANTSRRRAEDGGNLKHVIDPKYSMANMPKERIREMNKASNESQRVKRALRKTFKESMGGLLELALSDNVVRSRLMHRGIDTSDMQYIDAISMGLIQRAMSGDVNAAREARMIMGEYGNEEPANSSFSLTIKRAVQDPNAPKRPRPVLDEDDEDI